jgi:Zn-dependent protease
MILSLLFSDPIVFFALIFAMLISLALHEFSHAWAADTLGDDTPRLMGRLTINPLVHIDLLGLIFFFTIGFGWGKPVQFNPNNLKNERTGSALIGLAGPAANLFLAVVFGIILRLVLSQSQLDIDNMVIQFFSYIVIINVLWMLFNLIPIPPLDGSKLLLAVLPPSMDNVRFHLETKGPFILFTLIIIDRFMGASLFSKLFSGVIQTVTSLVLG